MPTTINRNLFSQIDQDSGSLTSATTVVHKFSEPGEYHGLLYGGSRSAVVATFTIMVDEGQGKGGTTKEGLRAQQRLTKADIDLRSLRTPAETQHDNDCGCEDEDDGDDNAPNTFQIEAGGYAVFYVPAGDAGGYAVEVYEAGESGLGPKVFDSRKLEEGDLLSIVLLRPGLYSVSNAAAGAKANLTVAYPEGYPGQLEPVKVSCTKTGVTPEKITVHPTQGLLFSFETPSRVKVDLVTPDDRPPKRRPSLPTVGSGMSASPKETKKKKTSRTFAMVPRHRT